MLKAASCGYGMYANCIAEIEANNLSSLHFLNFFFFEVKNIGDLRAFNEIHLCKICVKFSDFIQKVE